MEIEKDNISVWKKITTLFKSGPVVRHKIASGEKIINPQGSAKAFKKEISSLYVKSLASYANYERLSRYSDYNEMETTPELHTALDIYADEATVKNDDGNIIEITSQNAEIKETLETLFYDVININFNCWSWMRNFCKFGDFCLFVDANEENGILNLVPIPINEIEREEGFDQKDPLAVRFRWLTRGNTILENWQIIHFRLLGNDAYLPYGTSILEPARRIWRQLTLIEDAMLVYRIVRSPERRVFHIEVANTPPEQIENFIEQVKTSLKRNTIVDPNTGRVDLRYNPLSVEEDFFLPKRGEMKSTIDTLAGGQFPVRKNTPVPLLDGRILTIEELAAEYNAGKENWVYSVQDGTMDIVPGKVIWCGKNYTCNNIHRVWFDDDTYADMAPEHPIVMRDGSIKRADQVMTGESVMPFRSKLSKLGSSDYLMVQDPSDDEWKWVHRKMVDLHGITEARERSGEKNVVAHHIDYDRFNNRPDNLRWMGRFEHVKFHGENARKNLHTKELMEKNKCRLIKMNKLPETREATSLRNSLRWQNKYFRENHSGDNHWNVKKWAKKYASWSPEKLADFCYSNKIFSLKNFLAHQSTPFNKPEQIRSCLRSHGVKTWTDFANNFLSINPCNHKIAKVEILENISDDVFCMTVVGPKYENDRHNFALLLRDESGNISPNNGVFVNNTGDIEDVQYIQSKMFSAIKIPRAYLGYEDQLGSKATLAQEDVRFSKTIERVQSLFISELNKIAIIHLFLLGYSGSSLANFNISMPNPSTVASQQRLELWRMKLEVAGMAAEGVFDRGFIYRRIFGLNDKQIAAIKDGKRSDKLEDTLLMGIEQPQEPDAGGELATSEPGAEELPNELGGESQASQEQEPQQDVAHVVRNKNLISINEKMKLKKRNPGSKGNDASISTAKGKNLFSTGENPLNLSFGTEKQTASDPNDRRALNRIITKPLSDSIIGIEVVEECDKFLRKIGKNIANENLS